MIHWPSDQEAIELLEGLLWIPTPSGRERAGAEWLADRARNWGIGAALDEVGNTILSFGDPQGARTIVLLGHIDTVAGWIPVRIEGGELWGRGAVDAKGPLCAMVAGAARARIPRDVRVLVVGAVEEESATSRGARAIAARLRPDACIIGEPSGWEGVTLGYKGRLLVEAEARVAGAHSAGPEGSAADRLLEWWAGARSAIGAMDAREGGAFERVQASARSIESDNDGLEDRARMVVGLRLPPGLAPDEAERRIGGTAVEGVRLRCWGHERAWRSDRGDEVARALSVAIRSQGGAARPKVKTGTSDMNVVGPIWECPIAAYGPGDSSLDHTPVERVAIEEYLRSVRVLSEAIELLACGPGPEPVVRRSEGGERSEPALPCAARGLASRAAEGRCPSVARSIP